jgi:hypothetical protein
VFEYILAGAVKIASENAAPAAGRGFPDAPPSLTGWNSLSHWPVVKYKVFGYIQVAGKAGLCRRLTGCAVC